MVIASLSGWLIAAGGLGLLLLMGAALLAVLAVVAFFFLKRKGVDLSDGLDADEIARIQEMVGLQVRQEKLEATKSRLRSIAGPGPAQPLAQ